MKRMTPTAYWQAVARHDRYRTPAQRHGNADHAISGMIAELGELRAALAANNTAQVRSEAGDVLWYATNWYQALSASDCPALRVWPGRRRREPRPDREAFEQVARTCEELTTHHHYVVHRNQQPRRQEIRKAYRSLGEALQTLTRTPLGELAATNTAKLDTRVRQATKTGS